MTGGYGEQLLSKVVDTGDMGALKRYGIQREHFQTEAERQAFDFVISYGSQNGQAPSYATYVRECPDVLYIPSVSDSFEWMSRKLKAAAARNDLVERLQSKEFDEQFEGVDDGVELAKYLESIAQEVIERNTVAQAVGKTLEDLKADFVSEYKLRKEGRSFKIWKTPFESLNEEIGGLYSGDIYGFFAESGRGKSYSIIVFVHHLLRQGARVLVKSFEMHTYRWLSRLFSVMTAEKGFLKDEKGEAVGVPNREILTGKLDEEYEEAFLSIVDEINEYYPGTLILQAKGETGAGKLKRSLDELDAELARDPDIDVVVIDPIYGFSDVYGRNSNRTTGGAAEQTARRFETLVGDHNVVGIYAVQADVDKKDKSDEDGAHAIRLPRRDKVKTSKALLEIATILFSFDSNNDGLAAIGIEKGRDGGEDFELELISMLDVGVLKEPEVSASQFDLDF